MPVDIIQNPADGYIDGPNTPLLQNWESISPVQNYYAINNPSNIPILNTDVKIKDVFGTQFETIYSEFQLVIQLTQTTNTNIPWLSVKENNEFLSIASEKIVPVINNGMISSLELNFQNLNLLAPSTLNYTVKYFLKGKNAQNTWVTFSNYDFIVALQVSLFEPIVFPTANYTLNHFKNTTPPYFDFEISGTDWKVLGPINYILSSPNNDVQIDISTTNNYLAQGTGTKTLRFTINDNFFNNEPDGSQSSFIMIIDSSNNMVGSINFVLNLYEELTFFTNPTEINFIALFGDGAPTEQILNIIANVPFTFTFPYWLNITSNLNTTNNSDNLIIAPIDVANLSPGLFEGNIIFSYNLNGQDLTYTVPVSFNLVQNLLVPYSENQFNFTKDKKFLQFQSEIENTYFQLELTVEAFDFVFQSSDSIIKTIPFKIALFNKKQTMNIGLVIEKILYYFKEINTFQESQYNAANVFMNVKEIDMETKSTISEIALSGLKFLSGLTPKTIVNNNAILDINNLPKRVTKNSFAYINMMLSSIQYYVRVFKNNETTPVLEYSFNTATNTRKELFLISEAQANPGDVIKFNVYDTQFSLEQSFSKTFLVFPEGEFSTMILFEDEHKLLQSFEFTGEFSFKNDYESISQNLYVELVEALKKYDYQKTIPFSINTGFIAKSDIRTIESICESKRAWIHISDEETIQIVPITKSLPTYNVADELIQFDLEFQINRTYNEESYSSKF